MWIMMTCGRAHSGVSSTIQVGSAAGRAQREQTHLDGGKDDAAVGVLELRDDALADVLRLLLVLGLVLGDGTQNRYSAPLGALTEGDEEPRDDLRVEDEDGRVLGRLLDLGEGDDGVGDNLRAGRESQLLRADGDAVREGERRRTMGLLSVTISWSISMKPLSMARLGFMSYSFMTPSAAVLRTYGFSSRRHLRSGSAM